MVSIFLIILFLREKKKKEYYYTSSQLQYSQKPWYLQTVPTWRRITVLLCKQCIC